MKTSVVILTKNEERNIKKCLKSVSFCEEIILIDDYSTDKTVSIARRNGAKIYKRHLYDDFSKQRNFGFKKAKNKWVLFLDADEVLSPELAKEIQSLSGTDLQGYFLKRRDYFLNKKILGGESGGVWLLRLGRKSAGKWDRAVHEHWEINGKTQRLKNYLYHSPHPSFLSLISKINYYSHLHAIENEKEGKNPSLIKIIFFPIAKFIYNFVFRLGLRDGTHGFVLAVAMSFHSFLSWSSLYLDDQKK